MFSDEYLEEEYDDLPDDVLEHYGTPRHSGRYPWGSGENPYQHEAFFRKSLKEMTEQGLSEKDIMTAMGMSSTEFRQMRSISKDQQRLENIAKAQKLKEKGYSNVQIGKMFDPPRGESYIRTLLNEGNEERASATTKTAEFLKSQLETKKYLDVGEASERELSDILGYKVTAERRDTALKMLQMEGYEVVEIRVEQATNKRNKTTMKILAPAGTEKTDIYNALDQVKSIGDYDTVSEMTALGLKPPVSIDSSRVQVRYRDDGGLEKDGVIELRRGTADLSLGGANYAQVRIAVDGTHYLKGMAVYSDDLPDGVDILFNTNKTPDVPMCGPKSNTVLKPMKKTPDGEVDMANPFGATIKIGGQSDYVGADGQKHQSVINKVNEEGDWGDYSKTLSSQFLSKQPEALVKRQLTQSYDEKKQEFDTIMSLTNPAVKKNLLDSFSEDCDAAAVHLKAASLPRQAFQVLLPLTTIKDDEIYAPQFRDGEEVVLVRYPHAGVFEIPRLTVNNRNKEGKSALGTAAKDAVGISSKVAEQLSGADFDGDTALVIPVNDKTRIRSTKPLEELKDFDPKITYKGYPGMKVITPEYKQKQMGVVSNLITDMTLQGAPPDEIARAVKHSMCVIDAEKHGLDYQRSYRENGIKELQQQYQPTGGASTLISRAKSEVRVDERKNFSIDRDTDPETGARKYRETGRSYTDSKGNKVKAQEVSTKMAETDDARTLISEANTPIERAYANYANQLKALANQARKEYLATPSIKVNKTATKTYAEEVNSLKAKLNTALKNAPRERQAQVVANVVIKAKKADNPDLTKGEEKRLRQQALAAARARFGANRQSVRINVTDREWDAIQAGAISNSLLVQILGNTDMDAVKQRAMPRDNQALSTTMQRRIRNLLASGHSAAEVADAVGVSVSTVNNYR